MTSDVEQLEKLNAPLTKDFATDIILFSLPPSFKPFIVNYHMLGMDKSLQELQGMLRVADDDMKKTSSVLMIREGGKKIKKAPKKVAPKYKGKGKKILKPNPPPKAKIPASAECFYCRVKGHWKRNCPTFLADLKSGKVSKPSSSGIFVVEVNVVSSINDWVLDTGSCVHICSNMQALKNRRKLRNKEIQLQVGNGALVAAVTVGSIKLYLPNGLVMELENVYFVPSISKNIISVSCLEANGFSFVIKDNKCSIYKDELYYGSSCMMNGLYVMEMEKPVFNINKRLKTSHESTTYMWHCRLGHINEKRIKKLHKSGLLGKFDLESIDTCESCLRGKMTKAPFSKKGERASDLLGLIHTDVCGPMSTCARNGYSYFITFTDDCSRYGYVYLMRHKSESFERFKEFKAEVENQLNKSIKALRSDRGGEYLSLEFIAYLKECGIVSQLTPPGTPQWNGVSERRNRTLLDMVRSMMSNATLPKLFWGHALETAARTINMVPSKSVEKTPYELWFGKAPNMSYLKIWGCEVFVKRPTSGKLDPKADKCFFVGYPKETKGYYFYYQSENKIVVSRFGTFLESKFLEKGSSGSNVILEEIQDTSHNMPDSGHINPPLDTSVDEHLEGPIPQVAVEEVPVPSSSASTQVEVEQSPHNIVDGVQQPEERVLRRSTRAVHAPERYLGLHEVSVFDTEDL